MPQTTQPKKKPISGRGITDDDLKKMGLYSPPKPKTPAELNMERLFGPVEVDRIPVRQINSPWLDEEYTPAVRRKSFYRGVPGEGLTPDEETWLSRPKAQDRGQDVNMPIRGFNPTKNSLDAIARKAALELMKGGR